MKPLNKFQTFIYQLGGIFLLIGAVMPLFDTLRIYSPYIFILGAIMFSTMQMMNKYMGKNPVIRRLCRQQIIGSLLFLVAGFAMFSSLLKKGPFLADEWLIFLAMGTVFQVYTAFRIPAEINKENKK